MSDELKAAFPDVIPVARSLAVDQEIKDPNWVAGFTSGEGCFRVRISKSANTQTGYLVALEFKISLHSRDEEVLKDLVKYLGCGHYYPNNGHESGQLRVTKFSDVESKIVPFFENYQILGVKAMDYADFCKVVKIMKNKEHTSIQGLNEIRLIKEGMNRKRSIDKFDDAV